METRQRSEHLRVSIQRDEDQYQTMVMQLFMNHILQMITALVALLQAQGRVHESGNQEASGSGISGAYIPWPQHLDAAIARARAESFPKCPPCSWRGFSKCPDKGEAACFAATAPVGCGRLPACCARLRTQGRVHAVPPQADRAQDRAPTEANMPAWVVEWHAMVDQEEGLQPETARAATAQRTAARIARAALGPLGRCSPPLAAVIAVGKARPRTRRTTQPEEEPGGNVQ